MRFHITRIFSGPENLVIWSGLTVPKRGYYFLTWTKFCPDKNRKVICCWWVLNCWLLNIYNSIMAMGFFWQCLPFSWTTLRGKHLRHPIAVIEVVDTFGHSYWATSDKYPSNHFQQLSEEGLSMLVTWICISDGLYDHSANRHMPFLGSKVKRVFQENLLDFHPQHIQG